MGDYPDLEKNRAYNFLLNLPDLIKNLSDTNLQMVVHFSIMELTERGYDVIWEINKKGDSPRK
ncbi:MAG: hypothetical protein HZC10_03355 [Nitrospirae bacterium]|nr:hypothetical protein [Nitrospirota bacterium]